MMWIMWIITKFSGSNPVLRPPLLTRCKKWQCAKCSEECPHPWPLYTTLQLSHNVWKITGMLQCTFSVVWEKVKAVFYDRTPEKWTTVPQLQKWLLLLSPQVVPMPVFSCLTALPNIYKRLICKISPFLNNYTSLVIFIKSCTEAVVTT